MKKRVLILTLNDYIIYQPTILNLYDFLLPKFDITIVSFQPKLATKKKDETRNIVYLKTNFFIEQIVQKTDFIFSKINQAVRKFFPKVNYEYFYYNQYLPYILKSYLEKKKLLADIVIAVDFPGLKIAQEVYGPVHFLSLEIENNTSSIHKKIERDKIKSVFIQSKERYDYLFPGRSLPTFFVQNAPVFKDDFTKSKIVDRKNFIRAGTIDRRQAVLECIDFFDHYPDYKLVLKGGGEKKLLKKIRTIYAHLIEQGRIKIDQEYLPVSDFIKFISQFKIGLCFYSWDIIDESFNYATAPSGKLFMTLAAGVPVIASNISAFKFVEEYGAGVLINDYKPETIFKAMNQIEGDYTNYSNACYKAAKYFSFDKKVEPYIKFLSETDYG